MKQSESPPAGEQSAAPAAPRPDTAALSDRELARLILDRSIRPRVFEIRRLADAVAAKGRKKAVKKSKRTKSGKLPKIPGQKGKNKA